MHIQRDMFGYSSIAAFFGLPGSQVAQIQSAASARGGGGECDGGHEQVASLASNPIMMALAQALESLGLTLSGAASDAGSASSAGGSQTSSAAGTTAATAAGVSSASTAGSAGTTAPARASSSTSTGAPSSTSAGGAAGTEADEDAPHRVTYHSIARDIRHLMHALFQDIRAENLLAPAGTSSAPAATEGTSASGTSATATASSAATPFATGLAALISQVSGGSVPANLQRTFDRLVADLQRLGGASATSAAPAASSTGASSASAPTSSGTGSAASGSGAASGASSPSSAQSLLLRFLTTLQQDLGYGPAASSASTTNGLIVNQVA